jgi:hypothetical protein
MNNEKQEKLGIVEGILLKFPETRNSYEALWLKILEEVYCVRILFQGEKPLSECMRMQTAIRAHQYFQEQEKYLPSDHKVARRRRRKTQAQKNAEAVK